MTPQTVLDATTLIAAASSTLVVLVILAKMFAGGDLQPRTTVAVAVCGGFVLTALYALSNGLLTVQNAFTLVVAAVTISAAGAGVHSAATAALTNKPTPPAPAPAVTPAP